VYPIWYYGGTLQDAGMMKRVPVYFYRIAAGGEPVREWLRDMDLAEDRKRIGEDVRTVEFGWPIGMPTCRPLGDGLYEVRSQLARGQIARVFFLY
jgi:phage-related protein